MIKAIALLLTLAATAIISMPSTVDAANAADFKPGHIIDDAVFYDRNAMNTDQIQRFLESKAPNCDYHGTQPASDWGYPQYTHAQFAERKRTGTSVGKQDTGFHAPPYKCLTHYTQATPQMEAASGYCGAINAGNRTAAQIINDVAKACGINPQVLLVLLEKEQSLVTDSWPLNRQLRHATGFACPDTAPCDPAYEGFFYQVYNAARQFKVYQARPYDYNYIAHRTNRIYWHPDLSRCGSSQVYIENQATAALYIYTPYRPNQAALNNLYGTGDSCSSYGNRNFWRIFTDWFGSTRKNAVRAEVAGRYAALGSASGMMGKVVDNGYCDTLRTVCWQTFANGAIIWSPETGAWESKGGIRERWARLGYQAGPLGFPVYGEVWDGRGWWQSYQNGAIIGTPTTGFWESMGPIRERWGQTGYQTGFLGYPKGPIVGINSANVSWQDYEKGSIIWSPTSGAWETLGAIRERWARAGYQTGFLGYPTSGEISGGNGGKYQQYQNGRIYWSESTGAWSVHGAIRDRYLQLGGSSGFLGYPTSGEISGGNGGKYQQYQNGRIYWSESTGAWSVHGAIRDRYLQLGGSSGFLGYPTSGETKEGSITVQHFKNGKVRWSAADGILPN